MSKNKIPTPQEEHEEKVAETVDMITAEDLVDQAVYAANAKAEYCAPLYRFSRPAAHA